MCIASFALSFLVASIRWVCTSLCEQYGIPKTEEEALKLAQNTGRGRKGAKSGGQCNIVALCDPFKLNTLFTCGMFRSQQSGHELHKIGHIVQVQPCMDGAMHAHFQPHR
jgi:hypothetical protein